MMDTQTQQHSAANGGDAKNTRAPSGADASESRGWSIAKLVAVAFGVFMATLLIWLFGALATHHGFFHSLFNFGELEQLENTFSPVNAFFAGISGIGLIATLVLQQIQISGAKKDAEENNKLLREQLNNAQERFEAERREAKANNDLLQQQLKDTQNRFTSERFERIFFNLLTRCTEVADKISKIPTPKTHDYTNRPQELSFSGFETRLNHMMSSDFKTTEKSDSTIRIAVLYNRKTSRYGHICFSEYYFSENDKTVEAFAFIYEQCKNTFSHYYSTLYSLIGYIDLTFQNDPEQRLFYMEFVRERFTAAEQFLLFYHALYVIPPGTKRQATNHLPSADQHVAMAQPTSKYKTLIERNGLLHGLDFSRLIRAEHRNLYAQSAYGD